jgi:hypothetical protein
VQFLTEAFRDTRRSGDWIKIRLHGAGVVIGGYTLAETKTSRMQFLLLSKYGIFAQE